MDENRSWLQEMTIFSAFISLFLPQFISMRFSSPSPSFCLQSRPARLRTRRLEPGWLASSSFSSRIETRSIEVSKLEPDDLKDADVVVALGVGSGGENGEEEEKRFLKTLDDYKCSDSSSSFGGIKAMLADPTCSPRIFERRFVGKYIGGEEGASLQEAIPWTDVASSKRLLEKTE